jgi:hypothetical protein
MSIAAGFCRAAEVEWTNPAGGDFTEGSDWSGGSAPGAGDNAVFDLGTGEYSVNILGGPFFPDSISNNQLLVEADAVTLNLEDNSSYSMTAASESLDVGVNGSDVGELTLSGSGAVNANDVIVGDAGNGALAVENGAFTYDGDGNQLTSTQFSSGSLVVGNQAGAAGIVFIGNAASDALGIWTVNGNANIAAAAGSTGGVIVDDGQWNVTGDINVGGGESAAGGTATLTVNAQGQINPRAFPSMPTASTILRLYPGSTVNLNGGSINVGAIESDGGTFNYTSGDLAVGGDLDVGGPGDAIQILPLNWSNELIVGGDTNISGQTITMNGGFFWTGSLSASRGGLLNFSTGYLDITSGGLNIGADGALGANVSLINSNGFSILKVAGATNIEPGGTLTLNGGEFSTGTLSSSGTINFESGSLNITQGGLTIGAGEPLGRNLSLGNNELAVGGRLTINPGSSLCISDGFLAAGSIVNSGQFQFSSGSLDLTNSNLVIGPNGLLGGNVIAASDQQWLLMVSGQTMIDAGSSLTIAGGNNFETGSLAGAGSLNGAGGNLQITNGNLTIDAAQPLGSNVTLANTLTDWQSISVSGQTTITAGSTMTINGGSLSTGTLINNGTLNFQSGGLSLTNSDLAIGPAGPLGANVTLDGQSLQVSGQTSIAPGSSLTLNAGNFYSGSIQSNGTFNYTGGRLFLTNSGLTIGPDGLLGSNATITPGQFVYLSGPTTINAGSSLTLAGGVFYTQAIINIGSFNFLAGELDVNSPITIGMWQPLGANLVLNESMGFSDADTTITAGGALTIAGGEFNTGVLTVQGGGTLNVVGSSELPFLLPVTPVNILSIEPGGEFVMAGGAFSVNELYGGGRIFYVGGNLDVGKADITIGPASLFGPSIAIGGGDEISTLGAAAIEPGSTLSIAGGTFSAGSLINTGNLSFTSGELSLTNSNLTIGSAGLLGANINLPANRGLSVSGQTTICRGSALVINGGSFSTGSLVNKGNFSFLNGDFSMQSDLVIGPNGLLGCNLALHSGDSISASDIIVQPGSSLNICHATVYGNDITIAAGSTISIANGTSDFRGELDAYDSIIIDGLLNATFDGYSPFYSTVAIQSWNSLTLAGPLDATLSPSFLSSIDGSSPAGDVFDLATSGVINGEFTNAPQGAILDVSGQAMQISYQSGEITLTDLGIFVPEPSGPAILAIGGGLLCRRRRRSVAR